MTRAPFWGSKACLCLLPQSKLDPPTPSPSLKPPAIPTRMGCQDGQEGSATCCWWRTGLGVSLPHEPPVTPPPQNPAGKLLEPVATGFRDPHWLPGFGEKIRGNRSGTRVSSGASQVSTGQPRLGETMKRIAAANFVKATWCKPNVGTPQAYFHRLGPGLPGHTW